MAQLTYKPEITWSDIWSELQRMSSYEGRHAVTPSGESNYINVHLTDVDKTLILMEIDHALFVVQDKLGNLVSNMSSTGQTMQSKTTYTFVLDSARTSYSELKKMITEAIATYVMAQWVHERKSERYEFYSNLHEQMISGIKKSLTRKNKPSLDISYTATAQTIPTT